MRPAILIVDDDEVLGQVLRRVLTRDGHTALRATTSAQALELARIYRPRLALVDLCLPDGDGVELARTIRRDDPELAAVLMTAYPLHLSEHPELGAVFARVLTKPLDLAALRRLLAEVAGGSCVAAAD